MHLAAICLFFLVLRSCVSDDENDDKTWNAFKTKFNKTYGSDEEEAIAKQNFLDNLHDHVTHNMMDEHNYTKSVHEYSDMHPDEMKESLCGTDKPEDADNRTRRNFVVGERLSQSSWNWVTEGRVSPIKDQDTCGSCWAFTAAEAVEGAVAAKYNNMYILSPQQLINCAGDYGNGGCDGGWPDSAFQYMIDQGGIVQESCLPYHNKEEKCVVSSKCYHFKVKSFVDVGPSGDENAVAEALCEHGPLSLAIHVPDDLMSYSSGIFHKTGCPKDVNHAVLLVGYGTDKGQDYWLIKNSWGTSWGEDGYFRMARNADNMCAVASYASYPVL